MVKLNFLKVLLMTILLVLIAFKAFPCSMYKVTVNGKTMVGNNEDSWGRDASIWFEQGANGKFGIVCVGYARKYPQPDGAMNVHGLAFDAFSMAHKSNVPNKDPEKNDFAYSQLRTIMQTCKTVDEVYSFLDKLNLHVLNGSPIFNGGMVLFVDRTGKYLVVEANKMTLGSDDKFALANFSLADTRDLNSITAERYRKGVGFLNNKSIDTSLSYCTSLSDTMSVNRLKVGDGTLYTNIFDLNEGLIHLYFYHNYSKRVSFDLQEELAKGDHKYGLSTLFPANENYQKFMAYKTPQSSQTILIFISLCGMLFFFSFVFFMINFFRSAVHKYNYFKLLFAVLSLQMGVYVIILLRNQGIFYFPAPYHDRSSIVVSLSSYLPMVLLIVFIPFLVMLIKIFRQKEWSRFSSYVLATNHVAYLIFIGLFAYWKLFDIFG